MACKRLIIFKKCLLKHYVLQYRFSVENCAKFLGTINTHAHTNTLFSPVHARLSGYLHKLWNREGVHPGSETPCGSEGQTELQRAGSRHSPALRPLRGGENPSTLDCETPE